MSPRERETWNIESSLARLHAFVAGEELADIADHRDDIVVLTADLMTSNRTGDFAARHPQRFLELGIAEQNMVGVAAGLASCGYRPYVATFASFASLLVAEHLRTDLAYTRMPVRVLAHHAGIALGFYGTSHHATEDIALTRAIPHLSVLAPCDGNMLRAVLRATVDDDGPIYVRMGGGSDPVVYEDVPELPPAGLVELRSGGDVALVATGLGVSLAVAAADELARRGVGATVLDAVRLKPLDEVGVVEAAERTGRVLTVEEHNVVGGLGAAVAEVVARHRVDAAVRLHGLPDDYVLVGPPTHLYREYGLVRDAVVDATLELVAS